MGTPYSSRAASLFAGLVLATFSLLAGANTPTVDHAELKALQGPFATGPDVTEA